MVPKGVLFVCFLWIGILSAMPSRNDDGHDVPFRRNFQTAQEDAFSDSNVPPNRKDAQSFFQQETSDPTARMDLVKSIDDILHSPYEGPYLESLQPLLKRQHSFIRPPRDSSSFRGDSSPTKRLTSFSNKPTDVDQFPRSNVQTKFNHNKPPASSFSLQESQSYSSYELQRPVRAPTSEHKRKPFDYSSQVFGSDSQPQFETIHDDFGASFEPVKLQKRPAKDRYSNIERRPLTHQHSSNSQRHPESTSHYGDSFHLSSDQRSPQPTRPFAGSQRYSAPDASYSSSNMHSSNEDVHLTDHSTNPHGYSNYDRVFRPSSPFLSRRYTRNRRDLQSSQGIDTKSIILNNKTPNFFEFSMNSPMIGFSKGRSTNLAQNRVFPNDSPEFSSVNTNNVDKLPSALGYVATNALSLNLNSITANANASNISHSVAKRSPSLKDDFTHPDEREYPRQNLKHSRGKRIVYPTSPAWDMPPAFIPGPSPPAKILRPYNVVKPPSSRSPPRKYKSKPKRKRNSMRQRGFPRRSALRFALPFRNKRSVELSDGNIGKT